MNPRLHATLTRRNLLQMATGAAATAVTSLAVSQPQYPTKPITIVVAYPAGGDTDVLARMFGEKLSARLGQSVVVENRTGAGGSIGSAYVARSAPDGYTLLLAPNTLAIQPHVMKGGANYDPVNDFTPIIQLGTQALYVIVTTASGVNSMQELVAAIKAGRIKSYGSPGNGTPMHILAELFGKAAGVKLDQIPYRGSVPVVADMIGGHVAMMFGTIGPAAQHIASGKLKLLAVASSQRSPFEPTIPTLAELGFKDAEVDAWQALLGPKGMPSETVRLLNTHCNEILKMPDIIAKMTTSAIAPAGGDPARLGRLVAGDSDRYQKIVKEFRIQVD